MKNPYPGSTVTTYSLQISFIFDIDNAD